jgi:outer membrane protein
VNAPVKTLRGPARATASALLAGCLTGNAAAEGPSAAGLELGDVVAVTLSSNPDLALATAQIQVQEANLMSARAETDLTVETSVTASRLHALDVEGAPAVQRTLDYVLRARRLLRSGFLITAETTLAHSVFSTQPLQDTNTAEARLGVSMPLLRNRGGATTAAVERAAERDHRASRWDRRHAAAERSLAAVVAYWDYQAAHRRLAVLRSSEERAQRTVDETRVLVQADERTPADVVQVQGNLASKRVSRLSAEQSATQARASLVLAMGLSASAMTSLAPPATDFPRLAARSARLDAGRLFDDAYRRRADVAAAEEDELAARLRIDAARSELRPRLDLSVTTGYRAAEVGRGVDELFSPLYRRQPELDAVVQLTFEFPVANSGARGRSLQSAALHAQSRIAHESLRRSIAIGVSVGLETLARSAEAMRESERAVRLFESGVRSVQRKFQLGSSTLFDLIQAQDALTDAELSYVQSQRDYAVAIATLRFESGRLVEGKGDVMTVPLDGLLRPP